MLVRAALLFACILMQCCISNNVIAQAISVSPNSLDEKSRSALINSDAFYVNGVITHGLTPEMAEIMYPLGPMSRTLITLVTLRMNAAGLLDLDEPIARTLPDILEENPFNVAITPRHLLTETAGFAALSIKGSGAPINRFTTQVRTAGQMAHSDHVGWSVLIAFLQTKGGAEFKELVLRHLLSAFDANTLFQKSDGGDPVTDYLAFGANGTLIAELARLHIRNRDKNGNPFLPPDLYEQLVERHNWRMHPIGPRRTLGGVMDTVGDFSFIRPPEVPDTAGPSFAAFPDQGIAFVSLNGFGGNEMTAITTVASNSFLPQPDHRLNEARRIVDPEDRFNGLYVRSDAPSAWLKDRLEAISSSTVSVTESPGGVMQVDTGSGLMTFRKSAPYYYTNPAGEDLIMSPFRQGGYMVLDGVLYRYAGILGNKSFVLDAFPLVMLVLLSSAVYLRSKTSPRWPKMARFAVLGTVLIGAGLWADYSYWPQAVFIWDMPWLVTIWRLAINIGLALVLSLPLFAMAFTKKNELPQGAALFVVPMHLALMSVASLALFLILVAWGLAGEISAY